MGDTTDGFNKDRDENQYGEVKTDKDEDRKKRGEPVKRQDKDKSGK